MLDWWNHWQAAQQELTPGNQQSLRPLLEADSGIESSVFDDSNLANLLKGSRSVLCLSLPHISDSNVDAMWVPEAKESIPLKSTTVEIRPGFPRMSTVNLGFSNQLKVRLRLLALIEC
jgi:hypothetical protein